jgi:hypothetical protein
MPEAQFGCRFRKFDHVIVRASSDFAPETVAARRNRNRHEHCEGGIDPS